MKVMGLRRMVFSPFNTPSDTSAWNLDRQGAKP